MLKVQVRRGGFRADGCSSAKNGRGNDQSPRNTFRCMRRLWENGLKWRQFFRGLEDFSLIVGCTRRQKGDVGGDAGEVLMALFQEVVRNHGPVTVKNPIFNSGFNVMEESGRSL